VLSHKFTDIRCSLLLCVDLTWRRWS
jgi:hypothetical protein